MLDEDLNFGFKFIDDVVDPSSGKGKRKVVISAGDDIPFPGYQFLHLSHPCSFRRVVPGSLPKHPRPRHDSKIHKTDVRQPEPSEREGAARCHVMGYGHTSSSSLPQWESISRFRAIAGSMDITMKSTFST